MKTLFVLFIVMCSCQAGKYQRVKPSITIEGSRNVKVNNEDVTLERALQLSDSLHNIEMVNLVFQKNNQIDSLKEEIITLKELLGSMERKKLSDIKKPGN